MNVKFGVMVGERERRERSRGRERGERREEGVSFTCELPARGLTYLHPTPLH
jgi:hypothetical protein